MRLGSWLGCLIGGALVGIGCGGSGTSTAVTNGSGGQVVPGSVNGDIVMLPVVIDGATSMSFVVDTGSPLTLVDPEKFSTLNLQGGAGSVTSLDVGGLHLMNVGILAASPCGVMTCSDSSPAGLLGGNVLVNYDVLFDYSAMAIGFDVTPDTSGLGPPTMTAFKLEGGGNVVVSGGGPVSVPATRIAVNVTIEGTTHAFVLDTGSSKVLLAPDLYDSIVSDGRAQGMANVLTVTGTTDEPTTVLHTVALGDATQSNVAAVRAPFSLDALSAEVGHTVEGLLGGSYLSNYLVSIDYPNQTITLWSGL
jgi:Aspartyl protease